MPTITIPPTDSNAVLRNVSFAGYPGVRLLTWDTYRTERYGRSILGYAFYDNEPEPLFVGEDFSCAPSLAIDSNDTILSLLSFLTLRKGDTDSEYFDGYTESQHDWSESTKCESLSCDRACAEEEREYQFIIDL